MAETFGRKIKIAQTDVKIKGIKVTKNISNITHQQFADDTISSGIREKEEVNVKTPIKKEVFKIIRTSGTTIENVEIIPLYARQRKKANKT